MFTGALFDHIPSQAKRPPTARCTVCLNYEGVVLHGFAQLKSDKNNRVKILKSQARDRPSNLNYFLTAAHLVSHIKWTQQLDY